MPQHSVHPETRRRGAERAPWADTAPACFRSEGFAEDLPVPPPALAAVAPRRRPPAWWRRTGWRGAMAALGLPIAAVAGLLGL